MSFLSDLQRCRNARERRRDEPRKVEVTINSDRASIVAYLRAQIKRHGILGQIAEEIEQRKDRERG